MQETTGFVSRPLAGTLAEFTAVTINSSGEWAAAAQAATSRPLGILQRGGVAGDVCAARTLGVFEGIAAGTLTGSAFAVGEVVYTAASGVLTNISTSATALGICTKAAAINKKVEWIPFLS